MKFAPVQRKKASSMCVRVSVSRDSGGGPLPLAFPPTGYTSNTGLSSVLNNVPPSVREQTSGDNLEMTREMLFVGLDLGVNKYIKVLKVVVWQSAFQVTSHEYNLHIPISTPYE